MVLANATGSQFVCRLLLAIAVSQLAGIRSLVCGLTLSWGLMSHQSPTAGEFWDHATFEKREKSWPGCCQLT